VINSYSNSLYSCVSGLLNLTFLKASSKTDNIVHLIMEFENKDTDKGFQTLALM